jgi:transposase
VTNDCGHEPVIAELRQALAAAEARAAAAEARAAAAEARAAAAEARVVALEAEVVKLSAVVEELRARLDKNSSNSSKPPSSDLPETTRRSNWKPSGRKPGGQPGHPGHHRALVEDPDNVNDVFPDVCAHCGGELVPDDEVAGDQPVRHQVVEIPRPRPTVAEQRLHRCRCRNCGQTTRAKLPKGVPPSGYGPGAMATVAMLSGRFRLTRREVSRAMADLFAVSISVGSVQKVNENVSDIAAGPVDEIAKVVHGAKAVNADETSYPHRAKKAWLWVASCPTATIFKLHRRRNAAGLANIIPEDFDGLLMVDRMKTYERHRRSLCHAHLLRDWRGISERKHPEAKRLGQWAVAETERLLKYHRQFRAGELSPQALAVRMRMLKARYGKLLDQAMTCGDKKTEGTAWDLNRQWEALWAYLEVDGAEPTNNRGEQKIRPAVQWRKGSFGTWSDAGQRFVERILTLSTTAKQIGADLFGYLYTMIVASLMGQAIPALHQWAAAQASANTS